MWLAGNAKIEFDAKRRDINSKLQKQHCAPLCDEEVWGTRGAIGTSCPHSTHCLTLARRSLQAAASTPAQCSKSTTRY